MFLQGVIWLYLQLTKILPPYLKKIKNIANYIG
jgi:hypothetical protein